MVGHAEVVEWPSGRVAEWPSAKDLQDQAKDEERSDEDLGIVSG